jgi:cAMP-dependent protein kinase regulator
VIPKSAEVKQQILDKITKSFMFSGLEDAEIDIVVDAM